MSTEVEEFNVVVDTLFPNKELITDEALRRACVNRVYYAIYHHLLKIIGTHFPCYDLSNDGMFGNTGAHKRVFYVLDDIYKNSGSKLAQKLSLKFDDMLSKRHKADYYLGDDFTEFDFKQVLSFYKDIPLIAQKLIQEQSQLLNVGLAKMK